ncbi:dipeptidase [Sphingomonas humi]|uniref:Dipeptidase n=1 Tax=Sphingomonas humi TaxID=335630 RepID=A0ABP7RP68_9SPHN
MRLSPFLLAAAAASLIPVSAMSQSIDPKVSQRIDRILKATPLIDGHNDLPEQLRENYELNVAGLASGGTTRNKPLMTDMARLKAGRVGGQFWSVYIDGTVVGDAAIRQTIEQIDTVHRLVRAYPNDLAWATSADDLVKAHKAGKVGSLIGIEGGRQIGGSLAALRLFYDAGARYMTLTHNQTTEWADSATDQPKWNGLSPFGREVVGEMNRLGMLVDLSHVSPDVMRQAIGLSKAPVIFSHSSAGGIVPHPRNVPDDVLRLLPANGGVVMVNWVPGFISQKVWDWSASRDAETARLKAIHRASQAAVDAGIKDWDARNPRPETTVVDVANHVEHVAKIAGYDHVGIGADLDGIPYTPTGLTGVESYPLLFAELIRRGWSDANLAKLAGGNVLRALRGAEATARSLKDAPPSMAVLEPAKPAQ